MNGPNALLARESVTVEIAEPKSGATCSRCKTKERAPHQRYCRSCHAEYMRERRVLRRSAQAHFEQAHGHLERALYAIASGRVNCIATARAVALNALIKARPE
jgi:hypothetical protein